MNIFGIYRHSESDLSTFVNKVNIITNKYKNSLYLGDFNFNLLENNNNQLEQYICRYIFKPRNYFPK